MEHIGISWCKIVPWTVRLEVHNSQCWWICIPKLNKHLIYQIVSSSDFIRDTDFHASQWYGVPNRINPVVIKIPAWARDRLAPLKTLRGEIGHHSVWHLSICTKHCETDLWKLPFSLLYYLKILLFLAQIFSDLLLNSASRYALLWLAHVSLMAKRPLVGRSGVIEARARSKSSASDICSE